MPEKKIYTVATAHLDTQWNWTVRETISTFLPQTLQKNFYLFDRYPGYRFNFEGAFRYALIREYYPEYFERLKTYIRKGRWNVAGSSWESGDVNIPDSEALLRNILYGNQFFKREFNKESSDLFLPDCFGFSKALPTIAHHMGLKGFSTQKLAWWDASAYPIPFDIGKWKGTDGNYLFAVLNPGLYETEYRETIKYGPLRDKAFASETDLVYSYYGTGDSGGAPSEASVRVVQAEINKPGDVQVISASSDEIYKELENKPLPEWDDELIMRTHGVGTYTSRALLKRWNRHNEKLADAAERANCAAHFLGFPYPKNVLRNAWKRFLWHQFHDDITGTSIADAYTITYNDYMVSINQFAEELTGGVRNVASLLDTTGKGVPIIVFNPVAYNRSERVRVQVPKGNFFVLDPDNQVIASQRNDTHLDFMATVEGVGFKVYQILPGSMSALSDLSFQKNDDFELENEFYQVKVNLHGDIEQIYDKELACNLLKGPIEFEFLENQSMVWPSWEILYEDIQAEPREKIEGKAHFELVEEGDVCIGLRVKRRQAGSTFIQTIRLFNHLKRIEVENQIDWMTQKTLLKLRFPLNVANEMARYDLGAGSIERGLNHENLYEVPAQGWVDLSDQRMGVTLMSDCKYGWDHPAKDVLRLSVLHTPKGSFGESNQHLQDMGENRFSFAIYSHKGDFTQGTVRAAQSFHQPMRTFYSEMHAGVLGKQFTMLTLHDENVVLKAMKVSEQGDELIVRLQEMSGRNRREVPIEFVSRVMGVHETNGFEEMIPGRVMIENKKFYFDIGKNSLKSYIVKLDKSGIQEKDVKQRPVELIYNSDAYSPEGSQKIHTMIPVEITPRVIESRGIRFVVDPTKVLSAMRADGQKIIVGEDYTHCYFLAASLQGDKSYAFIVDGKTQLITIQDWREEIGGWDDVQAKRFAGVKTDPVAWNATHLHEPKGNIPYSYAYMFRYNLKGKKIFFPVDENLVIYAVTLAKHEELEAADFMFDQKQARKTYHLEVIGGSGSGDLPAGFPLYLLPEVPEDHTFAGWEPELEHMPEADTTIEAKFRYLGINLAKNAPVHANASFTDLEMADNAVMSGKAKWRSVGDEDKWLEVDLGQTQVINGYQVRHAGAYGEPESYNTSDFALQVYRQEGWETVDQVVGNTQSITMRVIAPTSGQRFRLFITKGTQHSNRSASIYSFELYGGFDV